MSAEGESMEDITQTLARMWKQTIEFNCSARIEKKNVAMDRNFDVKS